MIVMFMVFDLPQQPDVLQDTSFLSNSTAPWSTGEFNETILSPSILTQNNSHASIDPRAWTSLATVSSLFSIDFFCKMYTLGKSERRWLLIIPSVICFLLGFCIGCVSLFSKGMQEYSPLMMIWLASIHGALVVHFKKSSDSKFILDEITIIGTSTGVPAAVNQQV